MTAQQTAPGTALGRLFSGRSAGLLAAAGSVGLLGAALVFQYGLGLPPCELCIWQRWPHLAAAMAGAGLLLLPGAHWVVLGSVGAATSGGIGVYHTGVERGWWPGPDTCAADTGDLGSLSAEDLLNRIMAAPVTRCEDVVWDMLGLSMASWNALASFTLAGLWLMTFRRLRSPA